MKKCFKCDEIKPLSEFYKHSQMADGHLNKCKECNKIDVQLNYRKNKEYYKEYEKKRNNSEKRRNARKLYSRKLLKEEPERLRLYRDRYKKKYPEKHKTHQIFSNAVRDGKISKKPCAICGEEKVNGHHYDYNKPLEVIWVCFKHHMDIHAGRLNLSQGVNHVNKKFK